MISSPSPYNFTSTAEDNMISLDTGKESEPLTREQARQMKTEALLESNALLEHFPRQGQVLNEIADKDILETFLNTNPTPQYSQSVSKQNNLVDRLFRHFCSKIPIEPYPLEAKTAVAFLRWLAYSKKYKVSTLNTVISYSLLRLNSLATNQATPSFVIACMRSAIAAFYRDPTTRKSSKGATPLILSDVRCIIDGIFDSDLSKPRWASLLLFALATGSRGSTCSQIRASDITWMKTDSNGCMAVTIIKKFIKGRPFANEPVTLAGVPNEKSSSNFIYWLNRHLINLKIGTLEQVVRSNIDSKPLSTARLWPLSTDSMTMGLKRRMRQCGLDPTGYGFHSLRSGFMGSVLLNFKNSSSPMASAIDLAALVADWGSRSTAQEHYVKDHTKAALISTNLVGMSSYIDDTPLSSEEYHQTKVTLPIPPPKTIVKPIIDKIQSVLYNSKLSPEDNNSLIRKKFDYVTVTYQMQHTFAEAEETIRLMDKRNVSKFRKRLGIQMMSFVIRDDISRADAVAAELLELMRGCNILHYIPPQMVAKNEMRTIENNNILNNSNNDINSNTTTSQCRRTKKKREEWNNAENEVFIRLLEQRKSYREISEVLPKRSDSDCYFHLYAMNKMRIRNGLPPYEYVPPKRKPCIKSAPKYKLNVPKRFVIVFLDTLDSSFYF